eukprot:CAMPEP_0185796364 /NCGR_PEP_ID=MMETSP1174-20130828/161041_1 /TAXON_ID=35687 /ORGANISM="Dictyocha speculum, Strain CCMP1381" /LENGTH=251 /DNA_ID=CAMNT_0028491719 /DNA_START=724 /DNA_END=1479 /DNA_ORIENTATION=+
MADSPSDVKLAITMRSENTELAPLTFLFESYEPQWWFWEVLVCIERLLLTNATFFLSSQTVLRPFIVLVITLASVKLYSLLEPYVADSDDLVAEVSKWATVAMVIFAIIMQVHDALELEFPAATNAMLTTILLTVFGIFALFCVKSVSTEVTFFKHMVEDVFPDTTTEVKTRLSQFRMIFTRSAASNGLKSESTGDWESTHASGVDMVVVPTDDNEEQSELQKCDETDTDENEGASLELFREAEPEELFEI